jgi:hypothetical protein
MILEFQMRTYYLTTLEDKQNGQMAVWLIFFLLFSFFCYYDLSPQIHTSKIKDLGRFRPWGRR